MCTDKCVAAVERQRARDKNNLHVTRMTRPAETGNKHKCGAVVERKTNEREMRAVTPSAETRNKDTSATAVQMQMCG
jgi:hypothetical protein